MPDLNGRAPFIMVELELGHCALEYGVAPCEAVVPDGRNNYIEWSELFSPFVVTKWLGTFLTVSNNIIDAPDGTHTAARLLATSGGSLADFSYQYVTAPYATPLRFFIWVKRGNRAQERFRIYNVSTASPLMADATWDWTTSLGTNCQVVDTAANGWVRLQIVCTTGVTPGDQILVQACFYTGASSSNGDYTYIWGAQMCFPAYTSDFRYVATAGAVVPVDPNLTGTGTSECFNTFVTCQDRANFDGTTKVYKFTNIKLDYDWVEGQPPVFPVVKDIDMAPTRITPREGFGERASVSVTFNDFVYSDMGVDPYIRTRRGGADWANKSTFWRRFLARNANMENRQMRVTTGFMNEYGSPDIDTLITRTYLIQSVDWPNQNGEVTITGKDPLRLADSDRAVWPRRSSVKVDRNYTAEDTLLVLEDEDNRLQEDFDAGQVYIRIGDEIMRMTSMVRSLVNGSSAVTVERATMPDFYPGTQFNVASEIKEGASVVSCYLFEDMSLPDVLEVLLAEGVGIDSSFLPVADWEQAMEDAARANLRLSRLVSEPVAVKELLTELSLLNLNIWWDERANEIKMRPVLVNPPQSAQWNDIDNVVAGSMAISMNSRTRVTESWVYFGLQWPLADVSKLESFNAVEVFADLEAENEDFYGTKAIEETRSAWMPASQGAEAYQMAANLVLRYRYGKVALELTVDPKDRAPWTGDTVGIRSCQIVSPMGLPLKVVLGILQATEAFGQGGIMMRYMGEGQVTGLLAPEVREAAITSDTMVDYEAATADQKEANCFIAPDSGQFGDGTSAYTLSG